MYNSDDQENVGFSMIKPTYNQEPTIGCEQQIIV